MGVKVKQRKDKGNDFWVVVNHRGKRASFHIGSEEAANAVKIQLEAELGKGNLSCLAREKKPAETGQTFAEYAAAHPNGKKQSSKNRYESYRARFVLPRFGHQKLTSITRNEIKNVWLPELKAKHLAENSIKLALASLSGILSSAVEDERIPMNPALKLGKYIESEKQTHEPQAMEESEADRFLEAAREDKYYALFLLALEAGLREGEIIALPWKNVHFAQRYIWVARRWYEGAYGLPKGNKKRRVDMSLEIGRALGELRDQRMLKAFQMGRETIADDLVFPGQRGEPLSVWAMVKNHFRPTLKRAGLGHFRFHELRHTFGSILIQSGSSLPYVKDQMGHSTIQITVDTYCHLIAGRNVGLLDKAFPVRSSATRTQPAQPDEVVESLSYSNQSMFLVGRDQMDKLPISTPTADSKELQPLSALKSDKKQQKAQPGRNPDGGEL